VPERAAAGSHEVWARRAAATAADVRTMNFDIANSLLVPHFERS
jgi:hypothetical protein